MQSLPLLPHMETGPGWSWRVISGEKSSNCLSFDCVNFFQCSCLQHVVEKTGSSVKERPLGDTLTVLDYKTGDSNSLIFTLKQIIKPVPAGWKVERWTKQSVCVIFERFMWVCLHQITWPKYYGTQVWWACSVQLDWHRYTLYHAFPPTGVHGESPRYQTGAVAEITSLHMTFDLRTEKEERHSDH